MGMAPLGQELTESELIERAIRGNQSAFALLVERYKGLVFWIVKSIIVKSIVVDEGEAEDIVQEIFLKVSCNLPKHHPGESFKSWVGRIAYTTTIDYLRKNRLLSSPLDSLFPEEGDEGKFESGFEDEVARKDFRLKALSQLRPKERLCLTLFVQGYTAREIAEVTAQAIKENRVNSHVFRGRKHLKAIYRAMMQELDNDSRGGEQTHE